MSRSIGELPPIQDLIPDWMAVIIGLLTQLGDPWFLVLVLLVLYWTRRAIQDDVLLVIGMYVAGLGLYRYLKFVFELPRPNEPLLDPELVPWVIRPLYEATAFASSYGFPSGHATASTIVYFGLATILTAGTRRLRYLVASILVAVVGFSRVALGVHFLVDIVVGTALGGLVVIATFRGTRRFSRNRVTLVLLAALGTNALYVFESSGHPESIISFAIALGLFGGWQLVLLARQLVVTSVPSQALVPLVAHGGLAAASLAPLVVALETFSLLGGYPFSLAAVVGLGAAVVVVVPVARYSPRVQGAIRALSFWGGTALTELRVFLRRTVARLLP